MKQANKPTEPHWAQELVDNLNAKFAQAKPTRKEIIKEQLQKKQK
jgi:hypothetical protein